MTACRPRLAMRVLLAAIAMALSGTPMLAHHAAQAQFEMAKTIVLTGVLTKMEWINPHAYMHLTVKDASGEVAWALETVAPQVLRRVGLRRGPGSIAAGDTYTVRAFPSRDGSKTALIADLKMPDGRTISLLNVAEFGLPKDFEVPR